MTVYSVTGPDGQVHQFDADTQENAQKAFDWERMNSPAPTGSIMRIPLRAGDGSVQIYEAPSVGDAQKAMTWDQRQAQDRSGLTASVSRGPGDWMGEAVDWLSKGPTTTAVRGVTGLVDAPDRAFDFPRTMISPPLAEQYRRAMATPRPDFLGAPVSGRSPGEKLGDAFFRQTGIPEYQAETPLGRTLMAGGEGGISGAPFSVGGALQGAIGGAASQAAGELAPDWPRLRALAGVAPGAAVLGRSAMQRATPEIPTAGELKDVGETGYKAARGSPVTISRSPLQQIAADAKAEVAGRYDVDLMSQANRVVQNKIMQTRDLNMNDVINLRDSLNQVVSDNSKGANPNWHEVAYARAMLDKLDGHIETLGSNPNHIVSGTPAEAAEVAQTFKDARANYGAAMRSNKIGGELRDEGSGGSIMGAAQNRVEAANSGRNYDNILRSQVRQFMEKDSNRAGFSPAELDALDAARRGGFVRNRLRDVSNVLGGGPSLTSLASGGLGAGAAQLFDGGNLATALATAAPPALGAVARGLENSLARRSINVADAQVRMNSPEYRARLANMPPHEAAVIQNLMPGLLAPPPQPGSVVPGSEVPDPETGLLPPLPGSRTPRLPSGPSPDGRLYDWGDFRRLLGL